MTINIKRVYDKPTASDGFRVLVDRLWPRGIKKEELPYDLWAKEIAPSPGLRTWYHADPDDRWLSFSLKYREELGSSPTVRDFIDRIRGQKTVTLLYASKNAAENHALVLQEYLSDALRKR